MKHLLSCLSFIMLANLGLATELQIECYEIEDTLPDYTALLNQHLFEKKDERIIAPYQLIGGILDEHLNKYLKERVSPKGAKTKLPDGSTWSASLLSPKENDKPDLLRIKVDIFPQPPNVGNTEIHTSLYQGNSLLFSTGTKLLALKIIKES